MAASKTAVFADGAFLFSPERVTLDKPKLSETGKRSTIAHTKCEVVDLEGKTIMAEGKAVYATLDVYIEHKTTHASTPLDVKATMAKFILVKGKK